MKKGIITKVFQKGCMYALKKEKILHLSDLYKLLEGFEKFYKDEKSFKGAIRATLQFFSKDCKTFGGTDLFSSLDRDGFWTLSEHRSIQGRYKELKNMFGKYESAKLCLEYL